MRVTIIPADSCVIVDGQPRKFSFTVDENYHAVQWHGDHGNIETIIGADIDLESMAEFEDILDAHAAILEAEAEAEAAALVEFNLPENVTKRAIIALENEITPRRYREAVLTEEGKTWLEDKEAEIQDLRDTL